jgi:hypothetical protein
MKLIINETRFGMSYNQRSHHLIFIISKMKGAEESKDAGPSSPVQKKNPRTRFTERILKTIVGQEKANQALSSLSMGIIPGCHNSAFNIGSKLRIPIMPYGSTQIMQSFR